MVDVDTNFAVRHADKSPEQIRREYNWMLDINSRAVKILRDHKTVDAEIVARATTKAVADFNKAGPACIAVIFNVENYPGCQNIGIRFETRQ